MDYKIIIWNMQSAFCLLEALLVPPSVNENSFTVFAELNVNYCRKRILGKKQKHIFKLKTWSVVPVQRPLLSSKQKVCFKYQGRTLCAGWISMPLSVLWILCLSPKSFIQLPPFWVTRLENLKAMIVTKQECIYLIWVNPITPLKSKLPKWDKIQDDRKHKACLIFWRHILILPLAGTRHRSSIPDS